jgi:DNA-binding SARP family transcriptional activator/tetratricopeptide (TPR) repeat protein
MDLSVRLLGPLEADVAAQAADLGGPRQRAVLAMLLIARGAVVSVDRLIEDLWRGEPPPRATGSLQVYVSNLRRALEPQRAPRTPARVLVSAPPGYAIRLDETAVDAWHFEQLVRMAAEALDAATSLTALERALELWRGEALAEFAVEPWAAPEAARLDELRFVARERLVDARVRVGQVSEAVMAAEALVRDVPLREDGWRLLALSQYLGGRQGDALATLRRARQVLSDELGIDPGPRLAQLEHDVLAQSVELEPEPSPVAPAPVPRPAIESRPAVEVAPNFVGRAAERQALLAAAAAARPGAPALALVAGEAGGGKSALLAQLRHDLRTAGWRVPVGRCPEDEGGPPARAWADVLRALAAETDPRAFAAPLAALLSDDMPRDSADNALMGRFRLHLAVREWLSTLNDRPLAVLLDDVHRADAETRTLLAGLLDQGMPNRTLFVVAYRPETGEGIDELLAVLARHTPTRIRLSGLADAEVAELIQTITGTAPDASLVHALTARTDGNPFYLKESARLLASEGELVATSHVPEGVADVLRRRLARLPEESVSVLRLASVIGRDVDVALLIRAAEVSEDVVLDALETGLISDLLVEPGPGSVRFSHLLVRETLYAGVPQLRRVRWHARVADAVAELYPADLSALAHHAARAATAITAAEAARRCAAAAEVAASRFAFDSEAELYLEAQHCLELVPEPDVAALVGVMIRRVPALIRAGATTMATEVRDEAIRLAAGQDDLELLADAISSGTVPAVRSTLRRYGEVDIELVTMIERVLRDGELDPARRCRLLITLIRETSSANDRRCEAAFHEAVALARTIGDPRLIGMALVGGSEEFPADTRPAERDAIVTELEALGAEHQLPVFIFFAQVLQVNRAAVDCNVDDARRQNASARAAARKYQLRQGVFLTDVLDAMLAHMAGDLDECEQMYLAAFETQLSRGTMDASSALLLAMLTVRFTQGRLSEMVDQLRWGYENSLPAVGHLLALALTERGDLQEARRVVDEVPEVLRDYLWLVFTTCRALTVAAVRATDLAPELYEELLPYGDQVGGASTFGFALAPVGRALGHLARLLGRPDDALRHYEQARAVAARVGSQPWLDQVEADIASLAAVS